MGIKSVWGGLTAPIYIIGPKEELGKYGATEEDRLRQFKVYQEHGYIGFISDISACFFIRTVLSLIYGFQNICYYTCDKIEEMSDSEKMNIFKSDVIILGGPLANTIYQIGNKYKDVNNVFSVNTSDNEDSISVEKDDIINHDWLSNPIFLPKGKYIIKKSVKINNEDFCTITDSENRVKIYQDHGVFFKRKNPYDNKRYVFFIAGFRAPGTQAASASSVSTAMNELYDFYNSPQEPYDTLTVVTRIRGAKSLPLIKPHEENLIKIVHPFKSNVECSNMTCVLTSADVFRETVFADIDSVEVQSIDTEKNINIREKNDYMIVEDELEGKISQIIEEKDYEQIHDLLEKYDERALNKFYEYTENGKIDIKSTDGKRIWKSVISYNDKCSDDEMYSILSRLVEISRTRFQKYIHDIIYDALYAINGGVNGDFESGYWAANKYERYSLARSIKKLDIR